MKIKHINNIFKISWKLKSFIFLLIDIFRLEWLLYYFQKNVSKRSMQPIQNISNEWLVHEQSINKYNICGTLYEFGAGKGLAQNIYLAKYFSEQILVDLFKMIDFDIVNNSIKSINSLTNMSLKHVSKIDELHNQFGINYLAPYDARKTDLDSSVIDICVSTHTLEHIPKDAIIEIFNELKRIVKTSGYISALIDYSDHYAHTDTSISLFNYLNYNEKEWKKYNHDCHFQNRLRHHDYKEIFENIGFETVEENIVYEEDRIPQNLKQKFKEEPETTFATSGYFLLKNIK